ncbi:MAG: protease modulator HflK family protein [candidate division Zixibacteria bacterium]|nr:protease modulator HflK family protein [candidate division Zixibacteria bacterium]
MNTDVTAYNGSDGLNNLPPDPQRFKALVKASFIALGVDISLVILKALLYRLTGNLILSADAWHSAGDLAVTTSVLFSIIVNYKFREKAWARNAEGLVTLLISFILIFGGLSVIIGALKAGTEDFILSADIPLVGAIFGISIACGAAFTMFRYKQRIGRDYNSIAFFAESLHTFSDFLTSIGVLITLLLGFFGIHIERLMTFLVGIIVFRIGFRLLLRGFEFFDISFKTGFRLSRILPLQLSQPVSKIKEQLRIIIDRYKQYEKKIGIITVDRISKYKNGIIKFQLMLIIVLYFGTGFYSVLPYRTGVELLFGKVVDLTEPGLHYNLPKPFGDLILVDTGVVARVESGYRTVPDYEGQEPEAYLWEYTHQKGRFIKVQDEAISLTGDENIIDYNVLCYYRIVDPVKYAFAADDAHEMLRSLFCNEIHAMLGRYNLDTLLTSGRGKIQEQLTNQMRNVVGEIQIGVEILNVYLQEGHPPLEVVPQYRSVASARERKDEIIHQANAYKNNLIPRSIGQASALVLEAQGYASEKLSVSSGRAEGFKLKERMYSQNRQVQKERMRWEAIEKAISGKSLYVLPNNAKRRIFTSDIKQGADE